MPDFRVLAEEWVTRLEMEYRENNPCRCKERLEELLRKAWDHDL